MRSMADCQGYAHRAYAKAGAATIFIHNGAPQALVGCYENRMAGCGLMHPAHTADTRADVIFIDNGAPEVLVGCCYENSRTGAGVTWAEHWVRG